MRFVQKSPLLLAIACMILSSCAKEDLQAPLPAAESIESGSNLKIESISPLILPTQTPYLGIDLLPNGWSRNSVDYSNNLVSFPVGVSHLYRLWGDAAKPFLNGMSVIPWANNLDAMITVTTMSPISKSNKSAVKTKISSLLIGKKYALTVYVGSSLPKPTSQVPNPTYAKSCLFDIGGQKVSVDMSNSYHSWIQKVITFTATSPQMNLTFSASPKQSGMYAYAHLIVPYQAIKQVN